MAPYRLDVDAVTRLISQIAHDVVMPKFNALRHDEIHHKPTIGHVDDIVTDVDRRAEIELVSGLLAEVPSACVVAEEAAHKDPSLLGLVHGERPVWIIDPLDGTGNFANGNDGFGIMVGLAVDGDMRNAWIHLPARDEFFVAEAGSGAFLNRARLIVPPAHVDVPRGALFVRYMPPDVRASVLKTLEEHVVQSAHTGAAAIEYTDIAKGRKEFAVYYRLLPWDHGAPALLLREAGGRVEHLDGRPYTVRSAHQITLVARDAEMADRLRGWIGRAD